MTQDVWFITGASTGLGKALVRFLLTQKCKVVATARNPEDIKKYTQQYTNGRLQESSEHRMFLKDFSW